MNQVDSSSQREMGIIKRRIGGEQRIMKSSMVECNRTRWREREGCGPRNDGQPDFRIGIDYYYLTYRGNPQPVASSLV